MAQLTPMSSTDIDMLLEANWGLDVWERRVDAIVVAASEAQLSEIERLSSSRPTRFNRPGKRIAPPPSSSSSRCCSGSGDAMC